MSNILYANLARIFKSRSFVIGLIFSISFAFLSIAFVKSNSEGMLLIPTLPLVVLPMLIAAIVGILISPEFSHGTMRNKIIIGHRHESIYAAELISLSVISLIYYAAYEIIVFTVGIAVLGTDGISIKATVVVLLIMAVLLISNTAVSLFICMLVHGGKSIALVLALQYGLMFIGIVSDMTEENKALRIAAEFIPQGYFSSFSISTMPDKPWIPVVYPIIFGAVVTLLGVYSFKKSDMK